MPNVFDTLNPSGAAPTQDQYNTKLSPQDEIQFQQWKQKYAPNDSGADYDLRGAYKSGVKPDKDRGHFPDTYKKPNHPTFSDQSQYSGKNGIVGGHWGDDNSFTPSATNLQNQTPQQLQQYFKTQEPDSKLNLPQAQPNVFDSINPTKLASKYPGIDARGYPIEGGGDPGGDSMSAQGTLDSKSKDILLNALPVGGSMVGGIPGAAAGSFAKQALSSDPSISGGLVDTAVNGVIPAGIEAGLSGGIKAGTARLLSKLPQSIIDRIPGVAKAQIAAKLQSRMIPESSLVQTAADNAAGQSTKMAKTIEDAKFSGNLGLTGPGLTNSMSPAETAAVAKYNARYADNQIGGQLLAIRRQMGIAGDQPLSAVPKLMMSDVKHVENAILATGNPTIVRQIATNDLVTRNFTPSSGAFNPANMLDEMAGTKADAYKLALGEGYGPFKELLELGVKKGVGQESPGLFSWGQGRKLLIGGGALSLLGIPFKAGEAAILSGSAMMKIAQNPELGQMIIQAYKTGSKAPESTMLMKAIMNGLRGSTIYLQSGDGQQDPATIQLDQQGQPQLQYSRKSSAQ